MGLIIEDTTFRRATASDAPALTRVAHAAKRHWGYPERWIELWEDALTITPEFISNNQVYVALVNGEIAGFSALVVTEAAVWLEHLWVSPKHIGAGLGKTLFIHAAGVAATTGATAMEIESDPHAEGFYNRMGAKRVGEVVSTIEGDMRVLPLLAFDLGKI